MIFEIVVSDNGIVVGERKTTKLAYTKIGHDTTRVEFYPYIFTNRTDDELFSMFSYITDILMKRDLSNGTYIGVAETKALCKPSDTHRCKHCMVPAVEYTAVTVKHITQANELEYLNVLFSESSDLNSILTRDIQRRAFPQILGHATTGLWVKTLIDAESVDDAVDKLIEMDCGESVVIVRIKNYYIAYCCRRPGKCNNITYYGIRQAGLVTATKSRDHLKSLMDFIMQELKLEET